jgi:hypothetical protein
VCCATTGGDPRPVLIIYGWWRGTAGGGCRRYLSDPVYRRKISHQLNKGESPHALKRDLLYAHEGTVRARQLQAQTEQAW